MNQNLTELTSLRDLALSPPVTVPIRDPLAECKED